MVSSTMSLEAHMQCFIADLCIAIIVVWSMIMWWFKNSETPVLPLTISLKLWHVLEFWLLSSTNVCFNYDVARVIAIFWNKCIVPVSPFRIWNHTICIFSIRIFEMKPPLQKATELVSAYIKHHTESFDKKLVAPTSVSETALNHDLNLFHIKSQEEWDSSRKFQKLYSTPTLIESPCQCTLLNKAKEQQCATAPTPPSQVTSQ